MGYTPQTPIANTLWDIGDESSLNKAEKTSLRLIAKEYDLLYAALEAIWPFIEDEFPKGTGPDHGTCATEEYRKAAALVKAALRKGKNGKT